MSHPPGAPDDPPPYAAATYGPTAHGWPQAHPTSFPLPRTNGKAQAALWTGVAMLLTSLCGVGLLGFVPMVLGVLARGEIVRSGGRQGGDGMALAGIVTGAVALVLSLVVIGLAVLVFASYDAVPTGDGTTGV